MTIDFTRRRQLTRIIQSPIFHSSTLFVLAILIRLPYLGTFSTIDEVKWVEGAAQFLTGLSQGQLAQTYWHFFPGITITWGEVIILWLRWLVLGNGADLSSFLETQLADFQSLVGPMRLSAVFITSLTIPGIYLLGRRLLGNTIALFGAAFIAFDPFFVAHSRIVNGDTTAAGFMLLSVLAFLWLWQGSGLRMAVLSGGLAGLAFLTKLPAPIIGPWVGVLALAGYWQRRSISFWFKALIVWGLTAVGVFFLLWPAMWVAPFGTMQQLYHDSFEFGEVDVGHSTFFMQQISDNPGWLFYPVAIAFRLTPVTTITLALTLFWLVIDRSGKTSNIRWISWSLVAYVLFIILLANLSPKKLDRYVMAVFPPLDVLVAIGLWGIWQKLSHTRWPLSTQTGGAIVLTLAVTIQGIITMTNYPYLLTSYNSLLGGSSKAVAIMPVGWGEGLEQAAHYLNSLPEAETLTVSSWYGDIFHPYSVAQQASFSDDGRSQLAADYVVFYINQIQRQKPYAGLVDYFRAGKPVFVVGPESAEYMAELPNTEQHTPKLHWVEVYKAPAAQSASGAPKVEGIAQLLAYKIEGTRLAETKMARTVSESLLQNDLAVTLFFRVLGPLPPETKFGVALVPTTATENSRWGQWQLTEAKGEWHEGEIIEWHGVLTLPPDMPVGQYRLWVAFQFEDGKVIAEFPISDKDPPLNIE